MADKIRPTADVLAVREYLWAVRCEVTDALVLHDCELRGWTQSLVRLAGWDPNTFVIADLMCERALLDA